jgi:hypothetical protein
MDNEMNTGIEHPEAPPEEVDEARRDALRRLAKFSAYTAPTVLAMLASQKAPAQSDALIE